MVVLILFETKRLPCGAEATSMIARPVAVIPLRLLEKRMTELVTINDPVTHSECLA